MVATERERPKVQEQRAQFVADLQSVDPSRLVFIDEAGAHIGMTRDCGRAPRGRRVIGRAPRNRGQIMTMIGALSLGGVRGLMTVDGGTTGAVFEEFAREVLVPQLRPGDVVVLDNLGAHHRRGIRELIESAGARVVYMPAYSPDLNPIELCWSKFKAWLRTVGARTRNTLEDAIVAAVPLVSPSDALGWFRHCGYAHQFI